LGERLDAGLEQACGIAIVEGDADSARAFAEGADTLARNLHRWDSGYWSRYDLFPHPVLNVASSFYHALHTSQLEAMNVIAPRPVFADTARRFAAYADSRLSRNRAFARKVFFRLAVPRNEFMSKRMQRLRTRAGSAPA
jgi:hypothetical protein